MVSGKRILLVGRLAGAMTAALEALLVAAAAYREEGEYGIAVNVPVEIGPDVEEALRDTMPESEPPHLISAKVVRVDRGTESTISISIRARRR